MRFKKGFPFKKSSTSGNSRNVSSELIIKICGKSESYFELRILVQSTHFVVSKVKNLEVR